MAGRAIQTTGGRGQARSWKKKPPKVCAQGHRWNEWARAATFDSTLIRRCSKCPATQTRKPYGGAHTKESLANLARSRTEKGPQLTFRKIVNKVPGRCGLCGGHIRAGINTWWRTGEIRHKRCLPHDQQQTPPPIAARQAKRTEAAREDLAALPTGERTRWGTTLRLTRNETEERPAQPRSTTASTPI